MPRKDALRLPRDFVELRRQQHHVLSAFARMVYKVVREGGGARAMSLTPFTLNTVLPRYLTLSEL